MSRGTRFNRSMTRDAGVLSGTTLATFPSGSTIVRGGIETDGTLESSGVSAGAGTIHTTGNIVADGIDTGAGTAYKHTGGNVVWSGTTQLIDLGLTTYVGLSASFFSSSVTQFPVVMFNDNGLTSSVSVTCWVIGGLVTGALAASGGTIYWTAMGE